MYGLQTIKAYGVKSASPDNPFSLRFISLSYLDGLFASDISIQKKLPHECDGNFFIICHLTKKQQAFSFTPLQQKADSKPEEGSVSDPRV